MARNVEFSEEIAIKRAMEVFWKKGYLGASMRDLTDAMQINSSSLYNTIGDKRELFVRCIGSYVQSSKEKTLSNAKKNKSPLQTIINFINDTVDTIASNNSCLAIQTTFELASTDAEVKAILKDGDDFAHRFLLELVQEAIDKNEISADTEAETMTDFLINAFTGWHESYILHQDPVRIKKMANFLIVQLLK
ncbi:TetR family transcriptional regulator [Flavobacterium piscis]|uniref:TetR family transcriptional regulator n=1 Tax=Flavobacterium piscis TaxID=1114874 RepID=A0ABX2XPV9_9FLAO|nr:TetR/AcrR family transcriptional regulator [Flavobacterium piscis]OCB78307.1 TetR family transcriptional regulator [Flavobacterium piscis]OXG04229.1 TetR family transcriptional regulator [Flavobacterium piscis]